MGDGEWPNEEDRRLLRLMLNAIQMGDGQPPVYMFIDVEGGRAGIQDPRRGLSRLSPRFVKYEEPLEDASPLWLLFDGAIGAGLSTKAQSAFAEVLPGLAKRWVREPMLSPAQVQPVVVSARELWTRENGGAADLGVIGHLLEAEEIGYVDWITKKVEGDQSADWVEDPWSPFSIEIDSNIRAFETVNGIAEAREILRSRKSEPS